jgi:hypothetical protein
VNQLSEQDLNTHVPIVGWLSIVCSSFGLLLGVCGFLLLTGLGVFAAAESGEMVALGVMGIIGVVALLFFAVLALPGLLAGYGLLRRKKWGQVLGLVDGLLNLFSIPLGTAIGAYTLFVLLQNSADDYFEGQAV